jgi:DNA-binding GntR family transcriptional regulator
MGGQLVCKSRHVSRRRPAEDIGRSLGLAAGEPVLAIRCLWTVGGEPGALSASYLPERLGAALPDLGAPPLAPVEAGPPVAGPQADALPAAGPPVARAGRARALQIELAPPPPSVARSLRLAAGELVAMITVSFEDPAANCPVALTTAMLRPDLFRIVIQATAAPVPPEDTDGFVTAWTHTAQGWEP